MLKYIKLFIIFLLLTACSNSMTNLDNGVGAVNAPEKVYNKIRPAAFAGQFYSDNVEKLRREIESYFKNASNDIDMAPTAVKAIMVPHAGYVFSGGVVARGYKLLEGRKVGTAVIICNSHTTMFSGIAVDDSDAWETPFGLVEVDHEMGTKLTQADSDIKYNGKVHVSDHTLEVQVPFLQTIIESDFKILPVIFGNASEQDYKKLVSALAGILGEDDILIISTDMSHYPEYSDANRIDKKTLEMIKTLGIDKLEAHIKEVEREGVSNESTLLCGIGGVKTTMALAKLLDWDMTEILKYSNSGDTPGIGDRLRVVGYGTMVFGSSKAGAASRNDKLLNAKQKKILLGIARRTVEDFVKTGKKPEFDIKDERLNRKEGAFVTLSIDGQLKGCIGQIIPSDKPLWQVVNDMAVSACSEDHRFEPVSTSDLEKIEYEVSVLSRPERIDDWRKIEMGKHGVIVRGGPLNAGVFLPQVAEHFNNDLEAFLSELCSQKAGLSRNCYKNKDIILEIFTAQVFSKEDIN